MMNLQQINHHWVGIPALAAAIIGLGALGNLEFKRPTESLSQLSSAQVNQSASATKDKSENSTAEQVISQLKQIPRNAFGYAQSGAQSQNALSADEPRGLDQSEARDWTQEEWRLASGAVAAYRKGGKKALNPMASSEIVWQPPEEIAKQQAGKSR